MSSTNSAIQLICRSVHREEEEDETATLPFEYHAHEDVDQRFLPPCQGGQLDFMVQQLQLITLRRSYSMSLVTPWLFD